MGMCPGLRQLEVNFLCKDDTMIGFNTTLPSLWKLHIGVMTDFMKMLFNGGPDREFSTYFDIGQTARNLPSLEDFSIRCCMKEIKTMIVKQDSDFQMPCLQNLKLRNVEMEDGIVDLLQRVRPISINMNGCSVNSSSNGIDSEFEY